MKITVSFPKIVFVKDEIEISEEEFDNIVMNGDTRSRCQLLIAKLLEFERPDTGLLLEAMRQGMADFHPSSDMLAAYYARHPENETI